MPFEKMSYYEKVVYWMHDPNWYDYDENEIPYLTDKATEDAKKSFEFWKADYEKQKKTGICY